MPRNFKQTDAFDAMVNSNHMTRAEVRGFQSDFNVNLHGDQLEDEQMLDGDIDDLSGLTVLSADEFVRAYVESFDVCGADDVECWCAP